MTMAAKAIEVRFGERRLLLRRPRASEFDMALVGRLVRQFQDHKRERAAVPPGPGAVLEIDRYDQLLAACLEEIFGRVRTCIVSCATAVDGRPCSGEEIEEALGPVRDENLEEWSEAMATLLVELEETARLGE